MQIPEPPLGPIHFLVPFSWRGHRGRRDWTVAACSGLLPWLHVQFWKTENSWRLDHSHRGGHHRDIPGLVDASDVRTVNAFKPLPETEGYRMKSAIPAPVISIL